MVYGICNASLSYKTTTWDTKKIWTENKGEICTVFNFCWCWIVKHSTLYYRNITGLTQFSQTKNSSHPKRIRIIHISLFTCRFRGNRELVFQDSINSTWDYCLKCLNLLVMSYIEFIFRRKFIIWQVCGRGRWIFLIGYISFNIF